MSYCVNCGVQLDATAGACPLCDTPVYNPRQPVDCVGPTPYPINRGAEEEVNNREFTMVMTVVFATISVVCGYVNHQFLNSTRWSLYVMGTLGVTWVMMIPIFFRRKFNPSVCIALDGLAVALYIGMIAWLHPGEGWYPELALPIVATMTILAELFYLFTVKMRSSAITKAAVVTIMIAILTMLVEMFIRFHVERYVRVTWSAVVLLCCAAVVGILLIISVHKGLRNELRKRMHF